METIQPVFISVDEQGQVEFLDDNLQPQATHDFVEIQYFASNDTVNNTEMTTVADAEGFLALAALSFITGSLIAANRKTRNSKNSSSL